MENTNEFNRVLVAGCACVITSLLTYEEIERYKRYHPEALTMLDDDGQDVFAIDTTDGPGCLLKDRAEYTKALEIYKRLQIYPERVSKMHSWFQEQNRFSLKGKLHWSFVSDYQGSDAKDINEILVLTLIRGAAIPNMFLSRESLLAFVGTDDEERFFNSLLGMINGKEICFVFKRGGGTFVREKTIAELYAEAKAKGMSDEEASMEAFSGSSDFLWNGTKWSRVFDELRLKGNLLETIEDKDSEWVGEFFTLLLDYARKKYPESFPND